MGRITCLLTFAGMLSACSGADGEPAEPLPTSCSPESDRVGTYRLTWAEQSGSCGPIDSSLVALHPESGDQGVDADGFGCEVRSELISDGGCKVERSLICRDRVEDRTAWGGYVVTTTDMIMVTRQVTASGSRLEGTATVAFSSNAGRCRSTYAITAVRQ
jgi:hypothetical protein